MAQITLNIPDSYILRLTTAVKETWAIPIILNPEYQAHPQPTNPSNDPSTWEYDYDFDTPQYINEFSDNVWAKKRIIQFLADTLERYETRRDINIAKAAIDIPNDLAS